MLRPAILLGMLAVLAGTPARASVVSFDDAAGQAVTGGYGPGESFSDGGLTFTYGTSAGAYMLLWDASGLGTAPGSNGTNTLLVGASGTDSVTITVTGGGQFSLNSLLLGIDQPNQSETSDRVLVNGSSVAITNTATTYAINTGNVSSVTISGLVNGGYVSVDNVNYQVPEPATLTVLGVGLAGSLLMRGRRRRG